MMKKMVSLALALVLCLGLAIPAGALSADHVNRHSTIDANTYAYVDTSNNLMIWEGDSFSRESWEGNHHSQHIFSGYGQCSILCNQSAYRCPQN